MKNLIIASFACLAISGCASTSGALGEIASAAKTGALEAFGISNNPVGTLKEYQCKESKGSSIGVISGLAKTNLREVTPFQEDSTSTWYKIPLNDRNEKNSTKPAKCLIVFNKSNEVMYWSIED